MRPSNDGGPGTCYPGKRFWILILLSAIPLAFKFFGQDSGQVSRLRFGKLTSIFKKLSIFQKSDRSMQNGGNRSGSAPAGNLVASNLGPVLVGFYT